MNQHPTGLALTQQMKSCAAQRVTEGDLLSALVIKRQLEMCAVVFETHVFTELHSSLVAWRGGPWPFSHLCIETPTASPTLSFFPCSQSSFIHSSVNKGVQWGTRAAQVKVENSPDQLEINHALLPLATVCFPCTVFVLKANKADIPQDYLPVHFSV